MSKLALHEWHQKLCARFTEVNGMEAVDHYGDPLAEHAALQNSAGLIDLSFRSRLCLTGADRKKFLHGQVTNNVNDLGVGQGCYAALTTAKGKLQSDLNIYCLTNELLLDFEPGLGATIAQRLEKYIIADDVQVVDVTPHYGLLSVQGPKAAHVVSSLGLGLGLPEQDMSFARIDDPTLGEVYCMNLARGRLPGCDLFVPLLALEMAGEKLLAAIKGIGGRMCGWQALEMIRIEAGLPRFGADMDESNLPAETGIEARAISYTKGCYIGQEVIARIRTYGQVARNLCGLRLRDDLMELPKKGDKLFHGDKEVGYITSALASSAFKANIALGYVRRERNQPGTELTLRTASGESAVKIVPLPFALAS
jgi:folate-binding protein YgfZ